MQRQLFLALSLVASIGWAKFQGPDPQKTPGVLCSSSDPDFKGYDYPEKIARCNRNIGEPKKAAVAAQYGSIPKSEWSKYEFDHLIPLCAGGANHIENLWPQPIDEAKNKDVLEVDICTRMKAGTLKQADAVEMVHKWFQSTSQTQAGKASPLSQSASSVGVIHCMEKTVRSPSASPLSLEFVDVSDLQIRDPRISITENEKDSEVISFKGDVSGRLSRAQTLPLQGLILFAVRDHQDRYDVYLPSHRSQKFTAFLKLSFEDSYPKLTQLECEGSF